MRYNFPVNIQRLWKPALAALVIILLIWFFWPAARVTNLDSHNANIIAFGDSLTAGYGAQPGEDYPSRLSSITGLNIINAGVSGDTTESALARVDTYFLLTTDEPLPNPSILEWDGVRSPPSPPRTPLEQLLALTASGTRSISILTPSSWSIDQVVYEALRPRTTTRRK